MNERDLVFARDGDNSETRYRLWLRAASGLAYTGTLQQRVDLKWDAIPPDATTPLCYGPLLGAARALVYLHQEGVPMPAPLLEVPQ